MPAQCTRQAGPGPIRSALRAGQTVRFPESNPFSFQWRIIPMDDGQHATMIFDPPWWFHHSTQIKISDVNEALCDVLHVLAEQLLDIAEAGLS